MRLSEHPRFPPSIHVQFRQHILPPDDEAILADTIAYNLVEDFGGPERAAKLREEWVRTGRPVGHTFPKTVDAAFTDAVIALCRDKKTSISPTAKRHLEQFAVTFESV